MQGSTVDQFRDQLACVDIIAGISQNARPFEEGLRGLLQIVCRRVGKGPNIGTLLLMTPNGQTVALSYTQGVISREPNPALMERGLINIVRQSGKMAVANNLNSNRPVGFVQFSASARSELAMPFMGGARCFGAIDIASPVNNAFGQEDVLWLQHIVTVIQLTLSPRDIPEDIDVLLYEILRTALEATGLPDAYAVIILAAGGRVVPKRAAIRHGGLIRQTEPVGERDWSQLSGLNGRAIRTGSIVNVPNVDREPGYLSHIPSVKSELVIPIRHGPSHEVVGSLDIQAFTYDAFPSKVVDTLVSTLGEQMGTALYYAQQLESLKREQTALERLARVTPSVVRNFAIDRVYDLILEAVFSLLPTADSCQIMSVKRNPATAMQYVIMEHSLTAPSQRTETREPRDSRCKPPLLNYGIDHGIVGKAVRTQQTQYVADVSQEASYVRIIADTKSELVIPLLVGNVVSAALNIESNSLDGFSDRDRTIAELLAAEAGLAISNAGNFSHRVELLGIVVEATREVLTMVDDADKLFDTILNGAMRVTNTQGGYCSLILKHGNTLRIRHEVGEKLDGRETEWSIDQGLSGRALREKKPIYVEDVRTVDYYVKTSPSTLSNLVVPLFTSEGEAVGALNIESPLLNAFDSFAVDALQQFGPPVVAALIKQRLVDSLVQRQRETIDLIRHMTHMMRPPVQRLQEELRSLSLHELTEQGAESAADFLNLIMEWLTAKADVLGEDDSKQLQSSVDVRDLVARVLHAYRFYAARRRVILQDTSKAHPVLALVNAQEALGAFVEVLTNAVKYSPDGGTVVIHVQQIGDEVRVVVEDEGIGIPSEELEQITERGKRGSNVGETAGTGLGLYFVRIAMERQDGRLEIQSPRQPPQGPPLPGTRVTLRFQLP